MGHGVWGVQGSGGYSSGPPPATWTGIMSLSDADIHDFTSALQGVVMEWVEAALPSSSLAAPVGRVVTLLILHLRFACGVAGDGDMPPIWEAVDRRKCSTEGLATLNQTFMRGLRYCCRVFQGREHLSTPHPPPPPPPYSSSFSSKSCLSLPPHLLSIFWKFLQWRIFLSTLLALVGSALFGLTLLLQSNLFALIWSNPIFSLLFDPLTLLCSDSIYSAHFNPIQSACSLFPALLSPRCSLELLILLKITYH